MEYHRQFPRHSIQAGGRPIAIRLPNTASKLKNISKGGLAFQYEPVKGKMLNVDSIGIVSKRANTFIRLEMACRVVYDILSLEEKLSFKGSRKRQCGVCFIDLTENQQRLLELILDDMSI